METYEDLCLACDTRGLRLELYASRKLHAETDGYIWRALERLDITSADGRQTLISSLIVPGAAGGLEAAAAVALERLTAVRD